MIIDGLSWHQFSNLPHIASLPLNRQLIEYEIYNQNLIHEVMMIQQQQQLLYPNTPSAAGAGGRLVEQIVGNHIEFVVDTDDSYFGMEIETNSEITATINWGDEQTEEITLTPGTTELNHSYDPSGQGVQYTIRIEFSDATQVIRLEFYGND
jgi:hypothetical protein